MRFVPSPLLMPCVPVCQRAPALLLCAPAADIFGLIMKHAPARCNRQQLLPEDEEGDIEAGNERRAKEEAAAERRGLMLSMMTVGLSIPAIIGA
jgi:hypothetical protein